MNINHFSNSRCLEEEFAIKLQSILQEAIALNGRAFIAVSGGKTPQGLFKILAQTEIDWQKVIVTLTDERCVPVNSPDSNERMIKEVFLQGKAKQAQFISLHAPDPDLSQHIEKLNLYFAQMPKFDVVILGMGEDGHTASLFPCSQEIDLGLNDSQMNVLLVNPKNAQHQRISLSKKRLMNCAVLFLHFVGTKKMDLLNKALISNDSLRMPITAFINHPGKMQVMFAPE